MKADRVLTGLIVVSGLLAVFAALCPGWVGGPASSNDPRPMMQMAIPAGREVTVRVRRIRMKTVAIQRLFASELTLVEAAALFHHLNTTPAEIQDHTWRNFPGADDGERQCRQVIHWAGYMGPTYCTEEGLKAEVGRLHRELQGHIAAGGVKLPAYVPEE